MRMYCRTVNVVYGTRVLPVAIALSYCTYFALHLWQCYINVFQLLQRLHFFSTCYVCCRPRIL